MNNKNNDHIFYALRQFPELKQSMANSTKMKHDQRSRVRPKLPSNNLEALKDRVFVADRNMRHLCKPITKSEVAGNFDDIRKVLINERLRQRKLSGEGQKQYPDTNIKKIDHLDTAQKKLGALGFTVQHFDDFADGLLAVLGLSRFRKFSVDELQNALLVILGANLSQQEVLAVHSALH